MTLDAASSPPSSPTSSSSPILPIVDALTLGGEGAPALLVQLDADWAAVAVKPSGVLLVLLDARTREPWDVVVARATGVLRTESAEVIEGLAGGVMGVVLVGGALTADDLVMAPQVIGELGRAVHWMVLDPARGVLSDGRPGPTPAAAQVYTSLDKLVAAAHARGARIATHGPPPARSAVEREGEAALAAEAHFRVAMQRKYPPVTTALLAACVVVFLLEYAFNALSSSAGLVKMGALSGRLVHAGHYEGLLSYSLLHGGFLHIVMNGLALRVLGQMLENLIGGKRFLVVFTLSALGGGIASVLAAPDQLVVGASGGIFGLMTALFGLTLRRGGEIPTLARQRLRKALGQTLLLNVGISLLPGISLLGHAGGALVGFVLGVSGSISAGVEVPWLPRPEPRRAARMAIVSSVLAIACVLALASSLGVAFARGRPWAQGPGAPKVVRIDGTSFGVEVPGNEALTNETLPDTDVRHLVVGTVQVDPLLVEVHAIPLGPDDAADLATDEGLLRYFKSRKKPIEVVDGAPEVRSLHGARAVTVAGKTKKGSEYARWVFVDHGVLVDAEAILAPDATAAWRLAFGDAEPRIASSSP
jgi:membrane associated rhomboid family serine protease